jgi:hypothetical protein
LALASFKNALNLCFYCARNFIEGAWLMLRLALEFC